MGLNASTCVERMFSASMQEFAAAVGRTGPVTIAGLATRGGGVYAAARVAAPSGVIRVQPDEMIVECGAATPVTELDAALSEFGQTVAMPKTGTVGGVLATGANDVYRLGYGHVRDTLLQARYVDWRGEIVTVGGPTVKNVSGFDLCRLLVGSHGTLGFIGEVILRTQPKPQFGGWYVGDIEPGRALTELYRPKSLLWDGTLVYAYLAGHPDDVATQAEGVGMRPGGCPDLPTGGRWSVPPDSIKDVIGEGRFVAELGIGIIHHRLPAPRRAVSPTVVELHRRIKERFDPDGRLNPGVDVISHVI